MRLLGAWYTHNDINPEIILASLRNLRGAEICCAVWEPIEGNPHRELIQHQQIRSHLGIALQIGLILWEHQKTPFDAVCFLEHDVLYPHDYFSRVEAEFDANPQSPGVFNADYIGLNETGWLETISQRDPPLHQLSMRWSFAVKWIDDRIREYVRSPRLDLEPHTSNFAVIQSGGNPAVHINHQQHLSTHYDCYARIGTDEHPYWGDFMAYYPEGESDARE